MNIIEKKPRKKVGQKARKKMITFQLMAQSPSPQHTKTAILPNTEPLHKK
jgi:hypothetical protein